MENAILRHNPHWKSSYKNIQTRDILENILGKLYLRQLKTKKKTYINDNSFLVQISFKFA